jgi:hypothetical protein
MTRRDAVQFVMGFIVGTASVEPKSGRASDKNFVHKALKRGLVTVRTRQAGFFNALERIVDEELQAAGFEGDPN